MTLRRMQLLETPKALIICLFSGTLEAELRGEPRAIDLPKNALWASSQRVKSDRSRRPLAIRAALCVDSVAGQRV